MLPINSPSLVSSPCSVSPRAGPNPSIVRTYATGIRKRFGEILAEPVTVYVAAVVRGTVPAYATVRTVNVG